MTVVAGSLDELRRTGRLLTKVGHLPVLVVSHDGRVYAIEDRCPHMGFPLRDGTCENGLLTCHWHHARFDLESGCTLDPWADDAQAFDVRIEDDKVLVEPRAPDESEQTHHSRRLREGLENGLTLVLAKSALGLLEAEGDTDGAADVVRTALRFGTTYRDQGWGAGLTTLVAMANVLPHLHADDRPLALVHALAFVARDTAGRPPRFALEPLATTGLDAVRLETWYRRFVETRSSDAAERTLATAIESVTLRDVERIMFAAIGDHVFIDEGHTLDFTNKAFEAIALTSNAMASTALTSLVEQTCRADRSEESSEWHHPRDLISLSHAATAELVELLAKSSPSSSGQDDTSRASAAFGDAEVARAGVELTADDPDQVIGALLGAARSGANLEQLARAVAYAASLRIVRFHTQNDFGDWNSVHHAFTAANAVHRAVSRHPHAELAASVVHVALRVYLDRFLNVPAARPPETVWRAIAERVNGAPWRDQLAACWEAQGHVDEAGALAYHAAHHGDAAALVADLGHALVAEDAQFHWFQLFEAAVRQSSAWPQRSEEQAMVLAAFARFLAAHTPSRRELPTVVRIASRLRRGERLYEEA